MKGTEDIHARNQKKVFFFIISTLMFMLLLWSLFIYRQFRDEVNKPSNQRNKQQETATAQVDNTEATQEFQSPTNNVPPTTTPSGVQEGILNSNTDPNKNTLNTQTIPNHIVAQSDLVNIKDLPNTDQQLVAELNLTLDPTWKVNMETTKDQSVKNIILTSANQEIHFHLQTQDDTPCDQLEVAQAELSETATLPNQLIEYQNTQSGIELLYTKSSCDTIVLQSQVYEIVIDARTSDSEDIESIRSIVTQVKLN